MIVLHLNRNHRSEQGSRAVYIVSVAHKETDVCNNKIKSYAEYIQRLYSKKNMVHGTL